MKNKFYLSDFKSYVKNNKLFTNIFIAVSFIVIVSLILFFNFFIDAFFSFNEDFYKVGEPAKRDYVLKSDFDYYNEFETNLAKKVEEKLVLPIYKIDDEISETILSNYTMFYRSIMLLINASVEKEILKEKFQEVIPDVFNDTAIYNLPSIDTDLLFTITYDELKKLLNRGYISDSSVESGNGSGLISVISYNGGNTISENISAISVLKSTNVNISMQGEFVPYFKKLLNAFITVNCFYDNEQTKYNRELSLLKVEPIIDNYRSGDILIKKDFVVTNAIYNRIKEVERLIKRDTLSNVLLVLGYVFLLYLTSFVLFTESFIQKKLRESDIVLIASITLFYTVTAVLTKYFIGSDYSYLFPLIIPTILTSMLMTFLLGNRVGLYLSVLLSFLMLLISDFSIYTFSLTLIISILSTIIIHDVEKRIDLLKSSGQLALLQTILVIFLVSVDFVESDDIIMFVMVSVAGSLISGILTLALLPISEHWLKISTCFQLAELCDLNAPLLKSMLIKAPGTYAHSIAVANMAESAAQHIGANALLSKAGGYYHDIGKIDQPHYFIENQKGGKNLHDEMKPSLSVAVIKSHVKLGIEKAKNIGLPAEIIDIIQQHHGKGSIAFFLDRAKKENKGSVVLTEDFAYSGPNPGSPEAAIVMLADSVEAAVRSLKNPTISQLEKFVWELILGKLKEGMLDACGLTLSDLTIIKDSFISTLMGHYHSRIEYPSGDEEK